MKKTVFKKIVRGKIIEAAFKYLTEKKKQHSKLNYIKYDMLKIQKYLTIEKFTNENKILLFKLRTRMVDVKINFKNKYSTANLRCRLCHGEDESQEHLLDCNVLILNCLELYNDSDVQYEDIFSENVAKMLSAVRLFSKVLKTRDTLLENETYYTITAY